MKDQGDRVKKANYRPLVTFLLLAFLLAGCRQTPQVVKIGMMAPFEGQSREIGYDGIYAARLAVREFNENNDTIKLALVALDDGGRSDIALSNMEALANDPAIIAVVGLGSETLSLTTAKNFEEVGIPYISIGVLPFEVVDPANYPLEFTAAYEAVTPFDEVASEYAGSVYDAFNLIGSAISELERNQQAISAESMAENLKSVKIQGITGKEVFWVGTNTP
ncbi:MAG: ABC transporter substrate-binding protein [Chloroflexota bacterium]